MNRRKKQTAPASRPRLIVLAAFVLLLFAAAAGRAVHLQVVKAPDLRQYAQSQYAQKIEIQPARGDILDRNGERLASSIPGSSAFVTSDKVLEDKETFRKLCRVLSLDPKQTERKIARRGNRFTTIKRRLTFAEEEALKAVRSRWAGTLPEPQRIYPKKTLAGALLGFVGQDGQGLEGLEHRHDELLGAKAITIEAERDALASALLARAPDAATARGKSIELTLDVWIQHTVEAELQAAIDKHDAKGGIAIVMEPATGAILAMAQSPGFNPNAPGDAKPEDRKNRAVVDVFEPGSTMKAPFMALMLDRGKMSPTETIFCEQGQWTIHRRTIHDHVPHGTLPMADVLKVSSNIGVAKLSQRLDKAEFYDGYRAFGLGQTTGVDLPGESRGILPKPGDWSKITPMTMAYGQGVSATALQVTSAFAALANGGERMKPYVIGALYDENGAEIERAEPVSLGHAVSEKTANILREWMIAVVHDEGGTAPLADGSGYTVAGKTGTAWKPDPATGGYNTRRVWASFVGYAPAHDPRIVVLVAVDEPKKLSRYGGVVAGPAFREIVRRVLPYLGVPPDRPMERDEPKVASVSSEVRRIAARNRRATVEAGKMPDLRGATMREALRRIERTGVAVRPELEGSGFAARQQPAPGAALKAGTVCKITFTASP